MSAALAQGLRFFFEMGFRSNLKGFAELDHLDPLVGVCSNGLVMRTCCIFLLLLGLGAFACKKEVHLPADRGMTDLAAPEPPRQPRWRQGGLAIDILAEGILLQGRKVAPLGKGAVPAALKRGGPLSFFIRPLYRALRIIGGSNRGKARSPLLRVRARAKTPYRLVAEVLYTAGVAGFRNAILEQSGREESGRGGIRPVMPVPSRWRYGPMVVIAIEPGGFRISLKQHGRRTGFTIPRRLGQYDRLGLARRMADLRKRLRGTPLAIIKPHDKVPFDLLMTTWDTIRRRCEPTTRSCERQVPLFPRIALEVALF